MNLYDFPTVPPAKLYNGKVTPEQISIFKLINGQDISEQDLINLKQSIDFYDNAFAFLKSIDLSRLTEQEKDEILKYLDTVGFVA